jgi:hypothetical protein
LEGDRHGRVIESRSKIRPVYSLTTYHLSLISVTPVASDAAFFQASASPWEPNGVAFSGLGDQKVFP